MIAILLGAAGAGKSKQSQMLRQREHVVWLSAGELLRSENDSELDEVMRRGDLIDDDLVNGLFKRELAKIDPAKVVVLDGFPRHMSQAAWLVDYAATSSHRLAIVVHLRIPEEISRQRLKARARDDDNEAGIEQRLEDYRLNIHPVIEYFASHNVPVVEVDGDRPVEEVFADVDGALSRVHQSQNA